jgi:hypothetical protein
MKVIKFFISVILVIPILLSCGASVKEEISSAKCPDMKSIVVYNKTQNKYIADSILINEPNKIKELCNELKSLKEVSNVSVQANFGFYELIATLANGSKYNLNIIYTVYDGVVARDESGKSYKNNNLESTVLGWFLK